MNKAIIFSLWVPVIIGLGFFSCKTKPFVEHEIKWEKISDQCENLKPYFRMISNIGGERYEFEHCLDANFGKDDVTVSRQGDTVVVLLSKPASQKALFKVTLDIDSYPKYNFVTVDDETFPIVTSY